jgi:hypothetical protein
LVNAQFNHEECTMALSQSELIRLLESLRSTDGIELIRAIAERMVQELIEAEASAHIGAEWNEHTPTRTNVRNGQRDARRPPRVSPANATPPGPLTP